MLNLLLSRLATATPTILGIAVASRDSSRFSIAASGARA